MKAFGLLAMLASVIAAIVLGFGVKNAQSAPQEAAIAAIAAAIAIIPYVFYRALQSMNQADELAAIRQLLEKAAPRAEVTPIIDPSAMRPTPAEVAPEEAEAAAFVAKSDAMGFEGWQWHQLSNGAIRISDPHGAVYNYPSVDAAKAAFTWWQGPASA